MDSKNRELVYAIKAHSEQFERSMARLDALFDRLDRTARADMDSIARAAERSARKMEAEFAQATTGVAGKLRVLRTMTGDARSVLGGVGGALSAIGPGSGVFGAVGGFAGGVVIAKINETTAAVADLRAEAERAALPFEDFQELKFAFDKERVSIDALTDGFKELQLRADEFIVTGKGSGEEAFRRLGYGADELKRKLEDPKELFLEIITRLQKFDRAAQIRIADEAFGGTAGEQFVQLLDAGEAKLRASMQRARELGAVLSSEVGERASEVDGKFQDLEARLRGKVTPAIVQAGEALADLLDVATDVHDAIASWKNAADRFLSSLGPIGEVLSRINNWELHQRGLEWVQSTVTGEATEGQIGRQEALVAGLRDQLQNVMDQIVVLEHTDAGATNIEAAKRQAAMLADQLSLAHAELTRMQATARTAITVRPASSGPTDIGNRVTGSHVDLAGLETSVANGVAKVLNQFPALKVSSAYRSPEHNARVGGASNSRHMHGDAVDLVGVNAQNVAAIVAALQAQGFRGFGYYNNGSLHADMGSRRAWGPDRTAGSLSQTPYAFQQAVTYGPSMANVPAQQKLALSEAEYEAAQQAAADAAKAAEANAAQQTAARERQAEAIARVNEMLREGIELEQIENDLLREGRLSREEIKAALEDERQARAYIAQLKAAGVEVSPAYEETIRREIALKRQLVEANHALSESTPDQVAQLEELRGAFESFGQQGVDAFFDVVTGARTAEDAIKSLIEQLAKMVLQGALFGSGPLGKLFGGGLLGVLFKADGGIVKAASGGMIRGSGGPRGDKIPAMLSDGEYVVNARATRRNRELLEAMNSGRVAHLADGGIVTPGMLSAPVPAASGGSAPPIHLTQHVTQNLSLAGANGDAAIRKMVMQGAEQGARAAVAHVQANFGTMAQSYKRDRG